MFHPLLQLLAFIFVVFIFDGLLVKSSASYCNGGEIRCQNGLVIRYPFRLNNVSKYCGYPDLAISCADDDDDNDDDGGGGGGRPLMHINNHHHYVQTINYEKKRFRVVEADIDGQKCPRPKRNTSLQSTPMLHYRSDKNITMFYNCSRHPKDVVQNLPCLDDDYNNNNTTTTTLRSFAFYDQDIPKGFNWDGNCEERVVVPVRVSSNYTQAFKLGFTVGWSTSSDCGVCEDSGGQCSFDTTKEVPACTCKDGSWIFSGTCQHNTSSTHESNNKTAAPEGLQTTTIKSQNRQIGVPTEQKVVFGVIAGVAGLLLILLFIYRRIFHSLYHLVIADWKNKIKTETNVEIFLESCGSLGIQRYRYSEIKKMTGSFKETLGQGGYGSVFKGKLRDGRLVAVKILNESKGNGEDFINEVAAIGRTNHVNVVSLLGFCTDGTKRALVYEFMLNGSLEKFIYNEKNSSTTSPPLGWEKLFQITLGIARGLEYLHRGCNTRILHFDIKPHNILLDENFLPKISDFGLAKLCPTRESLVSMLVARGTIGYIAPEVYCRNFGGVSHKSDVYSYGMMVLEMIGGRKNIDRTVENTSEIYYPQWIYNHYQKDINLDGCKEIFEEETTRKMIKVALWCIQIQPADRPSISKVVEMLEGKNEELQTPPNPFQDPPFKSSP